LRYEAEEFFHGTKLHLLSRDDVLDPAGNLSGIQITTGIKPYDERAMNRKCVWLCHLSSPQETWDKMASCPTNIQRFRASLISA
jgi:hypothetical protein